MTVGQIVFLGPVGGCLTRRFDTRGEVPQNKAFLGYFLRHVDEPSMLLVSQLLRLIK
jgi:hypothetical protein